MRILFGVLCLGFFLINDSYSQDDSYDPKKDIQNISLSQWTTDDGLSSNNVTSVFQDSRGLLWITSFNGIMIFDGERIEIFDINNLSILETDGFYTTVETKQGVIYIGSQGSGLVRYQNGEFELVGVNQPNLPKSFPSLCVGSNGILYAGSDNQGLFKLENDEVKKINVQGLNKSTITRIIEDEEGKIWVATEGQGLFCLVDEKLEKQFTVEDGLLDNYIEGLACSIDGLMIASTNGLQYIDTEGSLQTVDELRNIYINSLLVDEWNSVWVGTEIGLARWNKAQDRTDWLLEKGGVDLVRISSLIKDKENSLWLSSSRTGLIRLKESMMKNLSEPNLSSDRVNIVHQSWDGSFYIGTDQNNIDVWNGQTLSKLPLSTNLRGNGIRDIYHDSDGSFWLATYIGMIYKKGKEEKVYSTENGMPANNFRTVLKDREGVFWFGSRSGGLIKFKDGSIQEVLNKDNKLQSDFVFSVTESAEGRMYIGTHSGGLTVIETDGRATTYNLKDDDSGILLFNIDMLTDRTALITANIGLIYFDGEKLTLVDLVSDRRSKTYFDLVDDKKGSLWVTSNLGILQISKSNWRKYLNREIEQLPYQLLDENNGMNNRECTGATRSLGSDEGEILVPTLGGVCIINPEKVRENGIIPEVRIRNVVVDNQSFNPEAPEAIIEAGALRYIFDFAVMSYTAPERNQFRYKLEGFDKDWSESDYIGSVEYTNLRPGKYTFKVIGANESNIWNTEGTSFAFIVKPFFYQTFWFYLLILVCIVVVFIIIYQWRISFINRQNVELKKVNAELDRFVYSASHEIRSPLSSILGLINLARMGDAEKRMDYFDHIEKSVNRLDEFIHDIVDYSRNARLGIEVDKIDFESMVSDIIDDISHTQNFSKIEHSLNYDYTKAFYSDPKRLKIVLSNIITNAFKHHRPDKVDQAIVNLSITDHATGVKVVVKDNGPGIDKKHGKKVFNMFYRGTSSTEGSGLGLYIVEETLDKIQGGIDVQTVVGEGSVFTIILKNLEVMYKKLD
ncbi:MAG: two-component regulator propeller domain-containing protein [Reichenbachiella sp.]|uniref:sensor histidine kinase n=1 Tax=Reichenbachiella sp. TaxID=2184521 RepID=UPI003265C5DF